MGIAKKPRRTSSKRIRLVLTADMDCELCKGTGIQEYETTVSTRGSMGHTPIGPASKQCLHTFKVRELCPCVRTEHAR